MSSYATRSARPLAAPFLLLSSLGACRAPEAAPLAAHELARAVSVRDASPTELGRALELAGLLPLALPAPTDGWDRDPERAEFWHACAWAWSPATRAARRRLEAARARADSAGRPGPIGGTLEVRDLGDLDANSRLMLTFDLIGLLGLGPAAAARELADAETRAALSALEEAMWTARFDVDAARVRLAAARAALDRLDALSREARDAEARIEILERSGRLSRGALASAHLALQRLAERRERIALDEARAREELALAAGLAPAAAALDAPGPDMLAAWPAPRSDAAEPTAAELLERVPRLRGLLLDYAIAEARLRDAAAQRWPSLALGPHLFWGASEFLLGAVVAAGLPWPTSLDGEIDAARVEREAARERVEDGLLAVQAGRLAARDRLAAARGLLDRGAGPAAQASARLWTAARARFAVDPTGLTAWAHALSEHAQGLHGLELARADLALAGLELERATGPGLDVPRLVESPLAEVGP